MSKDQQQDRDAWEGPLKKRMLLAGWQTTVLLGPSGCPGRRCRQTEQNQGRHAWSSSASIGVGNIVEQRARRPRMGRLCT